MIDGREQLNKEKGFTLLEVVAALAILVIFLVPILGAVSQAMHGIESAKNRSLALKLAQDKMTQIEMMPVPLEEGTEDGDFGSEHPGYRWEYEVVKTPDLQMMEEYIAGLRGMEIHLMVFWQERGMEKSLQLNTIVME